MANLVLLPFSREKRRRRETGSSGFVKIPKQGGEWAGFVKGVKWRGMFANSSNLKIRKKRRGRDCCYRLSPSNQTGSLGPAVHFWSSARGWPQARASAEPKIQRQGEGNGGRDCSVGVSKQRGWGAVRAFWQQAIAMQKSSKRKDRGGGLCCAPESEEGGGDPCVISRQIREEGMLQERTSLGLFVFGF